MPTEVVMPQMGESVAEGTITKWYKSLGDAIKKDEPLLEISTDKVDSEIPSPAAGYLVEQRYPEGETVEVDTVIAVIGDSPPEAGESGGGSAAPAEAPQRESASASAPAPAASSTSPAPSSSPARSADGRHRLSPVVRRIAAEHDVDLDQIEGSGSEGRITKRDILAYIESGMPTTKSAKPAASAGSSSPAGTGSVSVQPFPVNVSDRDRREPMSNMVKSIADHMVRSKHISPHVATVWEVDMTAVVKDRARHRDAFQKAYGFKLTYTPYVIKATVDAIKRHPIMNAQVDGTDVIYKGDINMGMAVAIDTGLIVPVIKQAGDLSFSGIARRGNDLALSARDRKLSPDDVKGGTFTITNPGIYGNLYGIPIINQPQVAILCVGGIEKRVVVDEEDRMAIRHMMYLSMSFDHRIINGADADRFMSEIKQTLQGWSESVL